jgi:hypothetical protein
MRKLSLDPGDLLVESFEPLSDAMVRERTVRAHEERTNHGGADCISDGGTCDHTCGTCKKPCG